MRDYWRHACATLLLSLVGNAGAEELEARLAWANKVMLGTTESGIVAQVPVGVGQRVKEGELLLKLEDRVARADLRRAQAQLVAARLEQAETSAELDRQQELYDRTVLSDHDLQLARIQAARGDADLAAAEAGHAASEVRLSRMALRAPFDAWVIWLNSQPGTAVINQQQAIPLVGLAATDRMLAVRSLDAGRAGRLAVGEAVQVKIGDSVLDASILQIAMEPDAKSSLYRMEAVFDLPEGAKYRAGERVTLILP